LRPFACSRTVSTLPLIVVGESYNGLDRNAQPEPILYAVPPAGGLVVDPDSGPNAIHLLAGSNRKYKVLWRGPPHRAVLDVTTLASLPGSEPFHGFVTGARAVIHGSEVCCWRSGSNG
jgi:hypothetical protein